MGGGWKGSDSGPPITGQKLWTKTVILFCLLGLRWARFD